jgi:hypothetical protein
LRQAKVPLLTTANKAEINRIIDLAAKPAMPPGDAMHLSRMGEHRNRAGKVALTWAGIWAKEKPRYEDRQISLFSPKYGY